MLTATKRTHHCSELTKENNGQEVCLVGWIDSIRDHGGVLFLDLRDRNGLTQVLLHPSKTYSVELSTLKPESVIGVRGKVEPRSDDTINTSMVTGEIEVFCEVLHVFNISQTPPFPLDDEKAKKVGEDLRLKYRLPRSSSAIDAKGTEDSSQSFKNRAQLPRPAGLSRGRNTISFQEFT